MNSINVQIVEIKKPVCPNYASDRTKKRFEAWATWDGYGRRPGYPLAQLKKECAAAKAAK